MTDSKQGFEYWFESELYVKDKQWKHYKETLRQAYDTGREHQREVDAGIAESQLGVMKKDYGFVIMPCGQIIADIAKAIRETE